MHDTPIARRLKDFFKERASITHGWDDGKIVAEASGFCTGLQLAHDFPEYAMALRAALVAEDMLVYNRSHSEVIMATVPLEIPCMTTRLAFCICNHARTFHFGGKCKITGCPCEQYEEGTR